MSGPSARQRADRRVPPLDRVAHTAADAQAATEKVVFNPPNMNRRLPSACRGHASRATDRPSGYPPHTAAHVVGDDLARVADISRYADGLVVPSLGSAG